MQETLSSIDRSTLTVAVMISSGIGTFVSLSYLPDLSFPIKFLFTFALVHSLFEWELKIIRLVKARQNMA